MPAVFQVMIVIAPITAIIIGLIGMFSPRTAWYYSEGWKYKNVEPSNAALSMMRAAGFVGVIIGIVFIVVSQAVLQGMIRPVPPGPP